MYDKTVLLFFVWNQIRYFEERFNVPSDKPGHEKALEYWNIAHISSKTI